MRLFLSLCTLAVCLPSLSVAAKAPKIDPHVVELARGYAYDPDYGPGNEQATVTTVMHDGKTYLVTVYMNSDVSQTYEPYQCKCSSMELDPIAGPKLIADQVQITQYTNGNRLCNHPKIASDGTTIGWIYGSDENSNRVQTYVQTLDHMCNVLSDPVKINVDPNGNDGAPDISWNSGKYWTAGYLNNGQVTYARGVMIERLSPTSASAEATYLTAIVDPANIGRPSIVPLSPTRSVVCAAQGDNRPPEDGVRCALIDAVSGDTLWNVLIAESDPSNDRYMNSPTVGLLSDGKVGLLMVESIGPASNNDKNASRTHLYVLNPDDSGPNVMSMAPQVGYYEAHAGMCTGEWGEEGLTHVGVFDASITGSGLAVLTLVRAEGTPKRVVTKVAGAVNGDSGYMSNEYGQNPNNQGRDFLRCIGDVANPGYGVEGGFLPNVKKFFALPYAGQKVGEPRNAMFLSLLPAVADPVEEAPTDTPGPNSTPGPGNQGDSGPTRVGARGCAVSVPGNALPVTSAGLAGLLGLIIVARRRRRG